MRTGRAAIAAGMLLMLVTSWPYPALGASDDPYFARQWNVGHVGAEKAWTAGRGEGVTIAIVDTGVDLKHPDLQGAFVKGHDFVDNDDSAMDAHGHGTHVAGIAAARAGNGIGIAGIAPKAKIMPVRVLDADGSGYGEDIEAGVRWAVDHGADVVNLSLAGSVVIEGLSGGTLTEIVQYAWDNGAVPVIAAGNGGLFRTDSSRAKRILVTATDNEDQEASYATSVGFADWGMAAPGGDSNDGNAGQVYSTLWKDGKSGYGWAMGTSMSAPHVAGAAAILRGLGLNAQETVNRILATAKDIGSTGDDFTFGNGLLNLAAATAGLQPASSPKASAPAPSGADPASPTSRPSAAATPTPGKGTATVDVVTGPTSKPAASPRDRAMADDEASERSALANLLLAGTLLGAAAALIGYGSWRRLRAKP